MEQNKRFVHVSLLKEVIEALNDGSLRSNTLRSELQSIIDEEFYFNEVKKSTPTPPTKPVQSVIRKIVNEKVINRKEIDTNKQ